MGRKPCLPQKDSPNWQAWWYNWESVKIFLTLCSHDFSAFLSWLVAPRCNFGMRWVEKQIVLTLPPPAFDRMVISLKKRSMTCNSRVRNNVFSYEATHPIVEPCAIIQWLNITWKRHLVDQSGSLKVGKITHFSKSDFKPHYHRCPRVLSALRLLWFPYSWLRAWSTKKCKPNKCTIRSVANVVAVEI